MTRYTPTGSSLYAVRPYAMSPAFVNPTYVRTNTQLTSSLDRVSGLSPNGPSLYGLGPNGPSIFGSSLGGVAADGTELAGLDFVDAEFDAEGDDRRLRIDDVVRGEYPNDDVLYYGVSVLGDDATPLCGYDAEGEPIRALALPGRWDQTAGDKGAGGWVDTDTFFFACQGSSVAKCFEMGFKPWRIAGHGKKIISQHEACVRALRADYCGDGVSHTVAGIELSIWTDAGDAPDPTHEFEGQWAFDGARCLAATRVKRSSLPSCIKKLKNCKESKSANVVLMTGFAPADDAEAATPSGEPASDGAAATDGKKPKKPKK